MHLIVDSSGLKDAPVLAAEKADPFAQAAFALGAGKAVDDIGERGEEDAAPGPHRLS
jgi:hypothetical protein